MPNDYVRLRPADGLESLTRILNELASEAASVPLGSYSRYIYRGHRDTTFKLLSSFHRELERPTRPSFSGSFWMHGGLGLLPNEWSDPTTWSREHRSMWAYLAEKAMSRGVIEFMEHALYARQLHGVAAVEASRAVNANSDNELLDPCEYTTIVGLAQHHGIATPFLDWTSNFYVALWFVVDDVTRQNRRLKRQGKSAIPKDQLAEVWGFPRGHCSGEAVRLKLVVDQTYPTAQGGIFTYDSSVMPSFIDTGRVIPLDERLFWSEDSDGVPDWMRPFRVQFPCGIVPHLKKLLVGMGHSTATLKPSLDNIARFVHNPGMP